MLLDYGVPRDEECVRMLSKVMRVGFCFEYFVRKFRAGGFAGVHTPARRAIAAP